LNPNLREVAQPAGVLDGDCHHAAGLIPVQIHILAQFPRFDHRTRAELDQRGVRVFEVGDLHRWDILPDPVGYGYAGNRR
jgi:hypothetical protein